MLESLIGNSQREHNTNSLRCTQIQLHTPPLIFETTKKSTKSRPIDFLLLLKVFVDYFIHNKLVLPKSLQISFIVIQIEIKDENTNWK